MTPNKSTTFIPTNNYLNALKTLDTKFLKKFYCNIRWYKQIDLSRIQQDVLLLAEQGNSYAQNHIGVLSKGDDEKIKWYLKSAKQGNSYAQHNIAFMYSPYHLNEGYVKHNIIKSIEWCLMSSAQNNPYGLTMLNFFRKKEITLLREIIVDAAYRGQFDVIKLCVETKQYNFEKYYEFMIKQYETDVMLSAIAGGHLDIVKYLEHNTTPYINYNNYGLYYAALYNKMHIIIHLIENSDANNFNWGLEGAIKAGNIDLVKYFLDKRYPSLISKYDDKDWDIGSDDEDAYDYPLYYAKKYNRKDIVKYLLYLANDDGDC